MRRDPVLTRPARHAPRVRALCVATALATFAVSIAGRSAPTTSPAAATTTLVTSPTTRQTIKSSKIDVESFVLTPAAVDARSLLHVDLADRVAGNAATAYLQAFSMLPDERRMDTLVWIDEGASIADYMKEVAEKAPWLDTTVPPMLDLASRRAWCDWETPLREQGIAAMMPFLSPARTMHVVLEKKVRLAVGRHDVPAALALMRVWLTMGDHVADVDATFTQTIAANSLQYGALSTLVELQSEPACPNLYWSLRRLPPASAELARTFEMERAQLMYTNPLLRRALSEELTAEEWREAVATFRAELTSVTNEPTTREATGDRTSAALPAAREHYARTRNLDAAVATIEPEMLVAMLHWETYRRLTDEIANALATPYAEGIPRNKEILERIEAAETAQPSNPFFRLLSNMNAPQDYAARLDRKRAAMTVVEAIRAYAAAHGGSLPATLDALAPETPVPLNPISGRPFSYRVGPEGAILSDDDEPFWIPMRYDVRIRR